MKTMTGSLRRWLVLALITTGCAGNLVAEDEPLEDDEPIESTADSTFGNTSKGSLWELLGADAKSVMRVSLPEAGKVASLSAYQKGSGKGGTQIIRGLIYSDAGGAPGALLGVTNAVSRSGNASAAWVVYNFAQPIALAAGDYWIGQITGPKNQLTQRAYAGTASAAWNLDLYSDGATTTFGTPRPYSNRFSLYATYTPDTAPPVPPPPPPPPTDPGLGTIGFHAYLLDSTINVDAAAVARRSDFIVIQRWRTDLLAQFRAANPKVKVLFYANLTGMVYPSGGNYSGGVDPTGVPESWFLHTLAGSRFSFRSYSYIWAANQGNTSYQQAWATNVISVAHAKGFDGVFLDDTNSTIQFHHTPSDVKEYPTDDLYANATLRMLQAVAPQIKAAGLMAIPNMGGTWGQWADWMDRYLAVDGISGGLDEFFAIWPGGSYVSPTYVDRAMQSQQKAENLGKFYLATTPASGEQSRAVYGLAACLLTAAGHVSYFAPNTGDYGSQPWYPDYDAARGLGQPLAAKYLSGALWRRDFANGYVTVDFTNHVGRIVRTR